MKKTLLCAALIAALSACDNNSSNNTADKPAAAPQQTQSAPKALTGAAQAEAAETRLKDLNTRNNQAISSMATLMEQSGIKTYEFTLADYQRGEQSSTATSGVTVQFSSELTQYEPALQEPIVLKLNMQIDHADALAEQGIIAKAVSRPVLDEAFKQRFGVDDDSMQTLRQFAEKLRFETTLLADDKVEQHIVIEPLEFEHNGEKLTYAGLDAQINYKQSDLGGNPIYPSTMKLTSGKFSFNDGQNGEFVLDAFEGSGEVTADGDINFKTTALHGHDDFRKLDMYSESLEYRGEKLVYDFTIGNFLGKQSYIVNGFKMVDGVNTVEFGNISFTAAIQKNGGLYDMSLHSQATIVTDFLQALGGISGVKINNVDIKFDLNKLSAQTINLSQQGGNIAAAGNADAYQNIVESVLADLGKNGSELLLDAAVDTQAGKATAKGHMKLVGVPADMDFSTVQPDAVMQYVDAALLVRVPEAIPQATGAAAMVEMQAGEFLKKEDGHYVLDFSFKDGKAVLNGKPLPL